MSRSSKRAKKAGGGGNGASRTKFDANVTAPAALTI